MKTTMPMKKTILAASIVLALGGAVNAEAIEVPDVLGLGLGVNLYTDRANLTMLSGKGFIVGGTNDVSMVWDGNAYTSSSDYTGPGGPSNITASSTTPFFGYNWTAHDIQVFVPGSYTFDVTLGGGNPEGTGTNSGARFLNVTVPVGDFGVHMLFDWNGNNNIDVFVVAAPSSVFGSGVGAKNVSSPCSATTKNCLWTGKGWVGGLSTNAPSGSQKWMLASIDGNGDGNMGIPMAAGGPFGGFNANFNANMSPLAPAAVPVPAAVWLLGSGLIGLLGVAKRRKR